MYICSLDQKKKKKKRRKPCERPSKFMTVVLYVQVSNDANIKTYFFYLLFGCPMVNFGPFSKEQSCSSDTNQSIFINFWPKIQQEPCNKAGSLNPAKCLVRF